MALPLEERKALAERRAKFQKVQEKVVAEEESAAKALEGPSEDKNLGGPSENKAAGGVTITDRRGDRAKAAPATRRAGRTKADTGTKADASTRRAGRTKAPSGTKAGAAARKAGRKKAGPTRK